MARRKLRAEREHIAIFALIAIILSVAAVYFVMHINPVPNQDSTQRVLIDQTLKNLIAIGSVVFILIVTGLAYTIIFFRKPPGDDSDGPPIKGMPKLEIVWTIIPLIIVIGVGIYGTNMLNKINAAPTTVLNINVTAQRWFWEFNYPDSGINTYYLELPVNQPILFHLKSLDVIHGFWIPALGPKQDIVPGMNLTLQLTPTKIGEYTLYCSQLCGLGHSNMVAAVYVVSQSDYNAWVKSHAPPPTTVTAPTTTSTAPPTTATTALPATTASNSITVNLVAKNIAFDMSTITVPAGATVIVNFDNEDAGTPHNFSVYQSGSASGTASGPIFKGQIITGVSTITYTFTAPTTPGTYFFRCDVHPTLMTGAFIVVAG